MQAVIMAGGKGTRLRGVTGDALPKPMAPVAGRPILEWQLDALRRNGVTRAVMVVGYLGDVIRRHFGDGGAFGMEISYFTEETPLGTAGALPLLRERLEEDFLLVFGDVIFEIDLARMLRFHREKRADATLFVHPNAHPFDSDLVLRQADGRVIGMYGKNEERDFWYDNCVNAGFYLIRRSLLAGMAGGARADLERDVLLPCIRQGGAVYAYSSPEYIKDVGTPQRIEAAARELESGLVRARCLTRPQRCIFLDRDGTVNRYRGLVSREEEFELEDCAARAIGQINRSGWLAIVVTNQPVVARGLCGVEDVERIHNKMKTLLGREGAYLDDVRFCPHHPDRGYPEENPAYKIPCACRKPDVGMLRACAEAYNIDLAQSWMVGDTTVDLQTGRNAGTRTALVQTGLAGSDKKYAGNADLTARDLFEAVKKILEMG